MKKLLFFLITVIFFTMNSLAFAQLKLDKYQEKLEIIQGKTLNGFIVVENASTEQVTVKTSVDDIVMLPPFDGNREFRPAGSTAYSFADWLTLSPEIFIIPALGKQKVSYAIDVPEDAKGGYYGTIFFEKVETAATTGVGVAFRIGSTISLITKDAVRDIKIEDVSLTGNGIKGQFLNSGNVILNSDYVYNLMDGKGKIADRGKSLKSFVLPPGEKFPFEINLNKKVKEGSYSLVINFNLASGGGLSGEVELAKDKSGNLQIVKVK